MEYRRPPPGRRAGRPRRDTPPPRSPTSPQAAGAPAPTPRGRGDGSPPARERSRSATRAPAPAAGSHGGREEQASPRLRTGTPHRSYPEKHNASDARFVACPGKAEGRNEAERPPALQAPPRLHNRGVRRTPPPQPAPPHMNATDPPRGAQPPQGQSRAPTPAPPRPQHVDRGPRQPAQ